MGNFIATRSFIYIAGNIINPDQNNQNETGIYTQHNAAFDGVTGHGHTGAIGDAPILGPSAIDLTADYTFTGTINAPGMTPLGSIIPFYDFSGFATFNSSYWKYCDGTAIGAGSPLIGKITPDLSNRYLVGFGTEGGGDIGSALWATAAVGKASHQVDLQHLHDDSHGHANTISASTDIAHGHADNISFSDTGHAHAVGTLQFRTGTLVYNANGQAEFGIALFNAAGALMNTFVTGGATGVACEFFYDTAATDNLGYTASGTGAVASGTAALSKSGGVTALGATAVAATMGGSVTAFAGNTGNALSTTQDIQPRSIRVRYIMRIK